MGTNSGLGDHARTSDMKTSRTFVLHDVYTLFILYYIHRLTGEPLFSITIPPVVNMSGKHKSKYQTSY